MKARKLLDGASYGPDALKAIGRTTLTHEEALREFAADIITEALNNKRLKPNSVLRRAEHLGHVDRVPATAEHVAGGAKCAIGEHVWVLADRLKE